ncbi:MAG: hypothetical protein HETSPECPRED_002793 [Heterodermia speciosa]|uniref:Histone acetyltransferase n=1 Tax=Heterodermia speciosa TaxID=116794 RepID=A0A8H3F162_9LECA|nr:MAG: hypothetical protein HETSPECPRED_002793 [Heterodermia speciosa]
MAAVASARLEQPMQSFGYNMNDSTMDAEGEEDAQGDYAMDDALQSEESDDSEASEAAPSAASEEEDENTADEAKRPTRSTRLPKSKKAADSDEDAAVEDASDAEESSAGGENESEKSSTDGESAAAEEWEGGSDGGEEASGEVATRNNCIFCLQDEEHDPSEEFEEYLACAVCGDNSHRQCARDVHSLGSDDDAEQWRCPTCIDNALEPDETEEAVSRRRSSASRLTRDLLPAARGTSRPGSHSIFNTLIVEDDPLDGSRSLRKRKTSDAQDEATPAPSKRRKRTASKAASEVSGTPFVAEAGNDGDDEEAAVEATEAASTSTRKSRSSRPSRSRRLKSVHPTPVTITTNDRNSIVVGIRLNPQKLASIVNAPPKKKKRIRPSRQQQPVIVEREGRPRPQPTIQSQYATPFYAFHEKENDDLKSKPYGGILSEADAETTKTLPLQADRIKFNEARQKAEEEWKLKTANAEAELEIRGRSAPKVSGPPSKIKCVNIGGYEIETWYAAPYPEEYSRNRVLYICEFCLKYMNSDYVAWRHKLKCPAKHPPGDEIYRDGSVSVFEVDGRKNPVYCQNLCLLAKLFLGSKTLYYDVEPFLFYVMTELDELGCHFVGYFSKEKRPSSQNNVSCILTLPTHQRKGYGNLLISFSYLLTRVEGKTGSPEKPLSDMGLVSYRNYWRLMLSYELIEQKAPLSITELSERTGMTADDIVAALEGLRALVRDPITKSYALRLDYTYLRQCIESWEAKGYVTLDPKCLVWTPYIMGRSNLAHYDHAPALPTIAPREGEEDDAAVAPEEGVQQALHDAAAAAGGEDGSKGDGSSQELLAKVNGDAMQLNGQLMPDTPAVLDPGLAPSTAASPALSTSQFASGVVDTPAKANGTPAPAQTPFIPAIRYEVFPPIPGTGKRRGGGWKLGGGRKSGGGTTNAAPSSARTSKNRSGNPLGQGKGKPSPRLTGLVLRGNASAPGSERKTRSALRDEGERERRAQFGADGVMDEESGSEEEEEEGEEAGGGFDEALEDAIAGDEAAQQLVIDHDVGDAGEEDGDEDGEGEDDEEAMEE